MSAKNIFQFKAFLFGCITDEHVLHRKHTHTGSVYGFDFSVQFIVQEEKVISRCYLHASSNIKDVHVHRLVQV